MQRLFFSALAIISATHGLQMPSVAMRPTSGTVHAPNIIMCSLPRLQEIVELIDTNPERITFAQSVAAIESEYQVVKRQFAVGPVTSAAGENMWTAVILCAIASNKCRCRAT